MGIINTEVNALLERPAIFADLVNGLLHGGEQVLKPEDLTPLPLRYGVVVEEDGRRRAVEGTGDVRMKVENDIYAVTFSGETQAESDYTMPVRGMLYDALEYSRQLRELEKSHKEENDLKTSAEFLSGIRREDRLRPVVNLVLYLGKEWEGSRSLHEMLALDREDERVKELLPYISDYRVHVIPVREIEEPGRYKTCLQHIFHMLRLNQDKKELYQYVKDHREELGEMDRVEMTAALALLGEQKRLRELLRQQEEEGKETDMCKAIDDLILDGKKEGEKIGETRMARLIMALSENQKDDLILKAASDSALRNELYREYQI